MVNIVISWNDDHGNSLALQKAQLFRQLFMVDFLPVIRNRRSTRPASGCFSAASARNASVMESTYSTTFPSSFLTKFWNASPKSVIRGD